MIPAPDSETDVDEVVQIEAYDEHGNYVDTITMPRVMADFLVQLGGGDISQGLARANRIAQTAGDSMPNEQLESILTELQLADDQWLASQSTKH